MQMTPDEARAAGRVAYDDGDSYDSNPFNPATQPDQWSAWWGGWGEGKRVADALGQDRPYVSQYDMDAERMEAARRIMDGTEHPGRRE